MNKTPNEMKMARAWLGLTQVELAAAMDLHVKSVRNMEQGIRPCHGPVAVLLDLMCAQPAASSSPIRPKYKDIEAEDWGACAEYDTVELKYDGQYAEFRGGAGGWQLTGRRGTIISGGSTPVPRCVVLCENITGTEWACSSGIRDKLIAWSAVDTNGNHLSRPDFVMLVDALVAAGIDIEISAQFDGDDAAEGLWAYAVIKDDWEGLVLRTKGGKFARMKCRTTVDYVCMGYHCGSILGGLYNKHGVLTEKVSVPGRSILTLPMAGDVFEASGLSRTNSGSLRNPRFERFRNDKDPKECV